MKYLSFLMMFSFFASSPIAEAQWSSDNGRELSAKEKRKQAKQEAKQARKEATQYYKEYIVKKRRALILVKNVEEGKDVERICKSFAALYEDEADEDMDSERVVGGYGRGYGSGQSVSEGAKKKAMDAERRKYQKHIDKINTQIEAEKTRIEEASLMTDQLQEYITKALE